MQTTINTMFNYRKSSYTVSKIKWKTILFLPFLLLATTSLISQSIEGTNLSLNGLPLQINFNESTVNTYIFDETISEVLSRNPGIITTQVNGNEVTIIGIKAGRTGLKITAANNEHYYIGVRVNKSDGSIPGLPQYLSIGSVSEDSDADLAFWKDVDTDLTGKTMDIRYIYINGGPINGWRSWGPERVIKFTKESIRFGLIPFFVYYNIPDGGESYTRDMEHVRSVDYMNAYFQDIDIFMNQAEEYLNGDLYGIVLEPDFLGYIQQNGELHEGTNDPTIITTAVSETNIAENLGTIRTLVERINKTINDKRRDGHKIFFGWQLNLWAYAPLSGNKGVLRRTDDHDLGWTAGRAAIKEAAEKTTQYAIDAGILTHGADFVSIDKYGLDAMGHSNQEDPAQSTWFFNNDHWMNYLHFVKNMHLTANKPIVIWQLPVGRINGSHTVSAYTNQIFPDLPNTSAKYEDSSTSFFLGDTFDASTTLRLNHFSKNNANDTQLQFNGNTITWGNHIQDTKDAGVIVALFGAGVGASTDGIGNPPTDNYFWVQKVQSYYQNGTVPLDKEYGEGNYVCEGSCPPLIQFVNPQKNGEISQLVLETVALNVQVTDENSTISSVQISVDGQILATSLQGGYYTANWTPNAYDTYSMNVMAANTAGQSDTRQISFTVKDPNACNLPLWDAETTYNINGTLVEYNGNIYESKWWTKGNVPGSVEPYNDPWKLNGPCSNPNSVPMVNFIFPANGTVFSQSSFQSINFSVEALDSDGSIQNVEFEIGNALLQGSGNGATYSANWTPSSYNSYNIIAKATDNDGATSTASINITIDNPNSNLPPQISFVSPTNNSSIVQTQLTAITVEANVTDDESVSTVEFVIGNQAYTPNVNGNSYSLSWLPTSFGTYTFECNATDNQGISSTSQISFSIEEDNSNCLTDPWSSGVIYNQGDKVSYNGLVYQAKWWTQGNIPGTEQWGPWAELEACNSIGQNARVKKNTSSDYMSSLTIYPNPTEKEAEIRFSLNNKSNVNISLFDLSGKEHMAKIDKNMNEGNHLIKLDLSSLPKGVYIFKILTEFKMYTRKIVKD